MAIIQKKQKRVKGVFVENEKTEKMDRPKLKELLECGYENTGKTFKLTRGEHKGKEFPVYAQPGDVAGLIYNTETDKIEMVFKLTLPYKKKF